MFTTPLRNPAGNPQRQRRRLTLGGLALPLAALAAPAVRAGTGFDLGHGAWTALLARHVVLLRGGQASQVRYAGFAAQRAALADYLNDLSTVRREAFDAWTGADQQAFLINAYNAFTVELILTRWPRLTSIKDIGGLLGNPWRPRWITLLGQQVSLDDIEHRMLRERGRYDEPRVHFAVNCASVGCPMLREQAYVGAQLDDQFAEQEARFMADRTRNRWSSERGRLELSRIFDWFGDDFRQGHRGIASLEAFVARHADRLADAAADRERLRAGRFGIGYLAYDWALNAAPADAHGAKS